MTRIAVSCFALAAAASVAFAKDFKVHTFKKIQITDKFYSEGAHFADFNRDGKMDVVSGPYWWEGPDFQKKHEIYQAEAFDPLQYSKNFLAFTYDFNNDKWPDVLVMGFPGEDASWYENPQGKEGFWKKHTALNGLDNESPAFLDLTGDGKPEIVCNSHGFFGYAEPDWKDASKPWKWHSISPSGPWHKFTHGLGVGDVNGDKRMDILEANGWWEQPASLSGDPVWTKHEFKFGEPGGSQMYAYDVDGDGDNDVITSYYAHGFGLLWYENVKKNGEITFVPHEIMNKDGTPNKYGVKFSQMHSIDLIDMDGDGLKDIVTGKRYWAHGPKGDPEPNEPAVLYWFKLVRPAPGQVDFLPFRIDDNSGVGTQVVAGNVNKDKLPDIVVGNKKGTFVHLHEVRKASRQEWEASQPKPVQSSKNQ